MKNCSGINCPMQYGVVDAATCQAVECCPNATPPLTNYDRIIYKSPEELADWLNAVLTSNVAPYATIRGVNKRGKLLDWLKQEAT